MEESPILLGAPLEKAGFDYSLQARPFVLRSLSAETRRSYENILKAFFHFHENKRPQNVTAQDVISRPPD